ncbi:radical SAM/SPASM domain-containing protein [Bradyrhizobium sp. HKCCYLRH1030]|uniref:radical SAM protein n=1 Tax=Bradyrhizobium sp. HKCCYLRH1030 TaxID=3420744 RepID=UPI003EB817C6
MRYVLRNEFFGGIVYDRVERDYLHLDHLAVRLLKQPSKPLSGAELRRFDADRAEAGEVLADLRDRQLPGNVEVLGNAAIPGMLSAPLRIFLEITYRCPEKCAHCYTESGDKRPNELSLANKLDIVDQMAQMGSYRLSIAGGEPLVDDDFFPVVERAVQHHIDVSFSTSGIPVTEKMARRLAELDIRTVNISLDGGDQQSYEQVRGEGRFKHMLRGVRNLRRHYPGKIAAKCTLMTSNIRNLESIIRLAEELEFDVVKFNCVREAGRAIQQSSLVPTQDEYIESMKILSDFYNNKKSKIKMVLPVNPYQKLGGDAPDFIGELGFGCYAGKESFCIRASGEIQPCTSFGAHLYVDGNAKTRALEDAWLNGGAIRLFRNLEGSSACQTCPSYSGCRGGCYLRSFTAYGDINATDPYCYERRNEPMTEATRGADRPTEVAEQPQSRYGHEALSP